MSITDLVVSTAPGNLDQLNRATVTELLERGKTWLRLALERGEAEITELVDYRAEATILKELVVQKELGKDAELAATELIRRAERAIAGAIRQGQERGTVGSREHPAGGGPSVDYVKADGKVIHAARADGVPRTNRISPRVAAGGLSKSSLDGHYGQFDGVSDQEYDEAIDEAKAEGVLTRVNVLRKLERKAPLPSKRPQVLRKTRRFDSQTVIERTVQAAEDVITPSLLAEVDFGELDSEALEEWINSLGASIRALNSLKTRLSKELTHR